MRGYPGSLAWGDLNPETLPDVNFQPHGYLFLATKVSKHLQGQSGAYDEKQNLKISRETRFFWVPMLLICKVSIAKV